MTGTLGQGPDSQSQVFNAVLRSKLPQPRNEFRLAEGEFLQNDRIFHDDFQPSLMDPSTAAFVSQFAAGLCPRCVQLGCPVQLGVTFARHETR
jgi:hypothetical protein